MLTFKQLMALPGPEGETEDEAYLRYRAQKRRRGLMGGTVGGPMGESVEIEENIGGLFKDASEWESSAKARGLVVKSMTHPSGEATKYQIAKDKQGNNRGHFDHGTKSGRLKEEVEELDEVLNLAQRRRKAMKLNISRKKIDLGRKRALARPADMKRLKSRAEKEARTFIFKKLSKGMSKDQVPYQRRMEIEKRMSKMTARIQRLAIKLLPKVRQLDVQRRTKDNDQEKDK